MEEQRARENAQRLRSLHRWRHRNEKAVSPVVATLILILIAVAAAAVLYLWLVAWQGGVTKGIGSPGAQYTLTIGGSTSVYPFSSIAATQFEQNNSDVVVSVNQGGSGAGMAAVCAGQVDIGEASAFFTASQLVSSDGCPQTVAIEIVAYDGVDPILPSANDHGVQDMSWTTFQTIYVLGNTATTSPSGGNLCTGFSGSDICTLNGVSLTTLGMTATGALVSDASGQKGIAWDEIPACAPADTTCAGIAFSQTTPPAATNTPTAPGTETACTANANDLCDAAATDATTCGFTVCAGGITGTGAGTATQMVYTYHRSDVSGTEQSFTARLLAVGASGNVPQGIGFTGCSGDNQLDGCGLAADAGANGNPAVIAGVGGNPDAIGFASDGLVQASSLVKPVNFQGYGQSIVIDMQGSSKALGEIAKGIAAYNGGSWAATTNAYVGWRPFLNVETAPPTGETLRYLQFVMDPANNENFAQESNEISVYASGLAGVVPVTPIP